MHPDLVVTNTQTIFSGALGAKIARVPHVWYFHEFGQLDHDYLFHVSEKFSYNLVSNLSSVVIANSEAVASVLRRKIPGVPIQVIYYSVPVPPNHLQPRTLRQSQHFNAVVVGRKAPGKGQMDAVKAIDLLIKQGIPARLSLVGSIGRGDYMDDLARYVQEHGLGESIDFVEFTPTPMRFVITADVALMCSRMEAFGLVTVEAMKVGTPVVGARSGGTSELIRDGITGLLYGPGDIPELVDRMRLLYHKPELAAWIAENARRWASNRFTEERFGADLEQVFQRALGAR
jgi:glycosyltransferase involved in cell wall biosynthesis